MPEFKNGPRLATLKFPAGVDNRSREYAISEGSAREITNLDVTRDGGLRCRKGTRVVTTGDFHSLFTHPKNRYALVAKNIELCRLDADETLTALTNVLGPVRYATLNDEVYWTDGHTVGRVTAQGAVGAWGLATPPAPQVTAVANGPLSAGVYSVAMTAVTIAEGLESPASSVVTLDVAENGGIQVITPSAIGVRFAIYRTTINGPVTELRRAVIVAPDTTVIMGAEYLGKPLESLYATKPVPGQCLTQYKGRLWIANKSVVWFTSEYSPHWMFPETGYYAFESLVTLLAPTEDGIYVGTQDKIYYLQGSNPLEMKQSVVSMVGSVPGSEMAIPTSLFASEGMPLLQQCAFYDMDGFLCIGKTGGVILRPTQTKFSAGRLSFGATAYCVNQGLRQLVTMVESHENSMISNDVPVRTIFANGVDL